MRRAHCAPATGRRIPKTWPGLAFYLNRLCSTLARRSADDRAPAYDGTSLTAGTARRFNMAWLGEPGAAGPKPDPSTDMASVAATIIENCSGVLTPALSGGAHS
jgi:hypothetical protein